MSEPDTPTLRIDVVSIFPAYLDALDLSLAGRAREKGLLQIATHDLRDFTHDRHRTVDDTPYGGGAGMVMKPEPWGEALDTVTTDDSVVVVPTVGVLGPVPVPAVKASMSSWMRWSGLSIGWSRNRPR